MWKDGLDAPLPEERSVAGFQLAGLLFAVTTIVLAISARFVADGVFSPRERNLVQIGAVGIAAALVLAIRPLQLFLSKPTASSRLLPSAAYRGVSYSLLIAATAASIHEFRLLAAVPLGFVAGADICLSTLALGIKPKPRSWFRRFFLSTLHFGVLGAILALVWSRSGEPIIGVAISLYAAMWLGLAIIAVVVAVVFQARSQWSARDKEREERVVARERQLRAHWLHDDVLSEVRLTTLRLNGETPSIEATRAELADLDHRLRLRQLDEAMRGGQPHLYEILQPHLRRAQGLGVELVRVPSLDTTDIQVDEPVGHKANRAISVLMSNALNAGASKLSIDVEIQRGVLEVGVADDAGGFDLDSVPAGRGLHELRKQLGSDSIQRFDHPGGSRMLARIQLPRDGATDDGAKPGNKGRRTSKP